jgi:hypothetical protein
VEWIVFGLLFWFFYNRSKKKRAKKEFEKALRGQSKLQNKYDRYLGSLPALKGDGSFSQQIRGEQAYREAIDLFGQFLLDYHPGEDEILVMVEVEPNNRYDSNAVRVEAGQTTVGYIPREQALEFGNELMEFGGRATCTARLYWSPEDGRSSITLDVVRPLEIEAS